MKRLFSPKQMKERTERFPEEAAACAAQVEHFSVLFA